MIGARQCAGSTISNGGDNSPSNWVIVGRRPLTSAILPDMAHFCQKIGMFYEAALSVITAILPSEKSRD